MLIRLGNAFVNLDRLEMVSLEGGRQPAAYLKFDSGRVEAVTGETFESMEKELTDLAARCEPAAA